MVAEVACWMQTGERQAARMRIEYLEAMLHQDVGFFDIDGCTTTIVSSLASDTLLVQDAISEKVSKILRTPTLTGPYLRLPASHRCD